MSDLISKLSDLRSQYNCFDENERDAYDTLSEAIKVLSAEPEVIRCKDCKHQEKFFHTDGRRKGGGYYIYGCDFAEGYSHVCLDDDFCSRAERRTEE